jgi:hypothetical protein
MLLTKKVIKDKKSHAQIRSVIFTLLLDAWQDFSNEKEKD